MNPAGFWHVGFSLSILNSAVKKFGYLKKRLLPSGMFPKLWT